MSRIIVSLQLANDVNQDALVYCYLCIDGCDGSVHFLKRQTLFFGRLWFSKDLKYDDLEKNGKQTLSLSTMACCPRIRLPSNDI